MSAGRAAGVPTGSAVAWRSATVTSVDGTPIGLRSAGTGDAVVVVGGALMSSTDYLPLGAELARGFEVHLMDRRGRGASGPPGPGYGLAAECDDLRAVLAATGARLVFGHSYGGLIALALAADPAANGIQRFAVYEPGLSIDGSIPTGWIPRYRELLAAGRRRRAFAHFVLRSGGAPAMVARLPEWYLATVLRFVVRGEEWVRRDELLESNAAEHEQVAAAGADGLPGRLGAIGAELLVLSGSRSPARLTGPPTSALHRSVPRCTVRTLDGLDHLAPGSKAGPAVARALAPFLAG